MANNGTTTSKAARDLSPGDIIRKGSGTYIVEDATTTGPYTSLELVRVLVDGSQGQRYYPTVGAAATFEFSPRAVSA